MIRLSCLIFAIQLAAGAAFGAQAGQLYEGRTVAEWLEQTRSTDDQENQKARSMLVEIGSPAVAPIRARMRSGRVDPELIWSLVTIMMNQLVATDLGWRAPANYGTTRLRLREDPSANYRDMASLLESVFRVAQRNTSIWRRSGLGLAKLRLLAGDWEGMNAAREGLGLAPIPESERPWLTAPPKVWIGEDAGEWSRADASLTGGSATLVFHFEKDGRPLAGVHVLVSPRPDSERDFRSGIRRDTLLFSPGPIPRNFIRDGWTRTFGYGDERGRPGTRYAVSGETGEIEFEKLPAIPVKVEILVPTGNFTEALPAWEMWMEVAPGEWKEAKMFGGSAAVSHADGPAVIELAAGETRVYPRVQIRPQFGLNVADWEPIDANRFTLDWGGIDPDLAARVADYELRMELAAPQLREGDHLRMPPIASASVTTPETSWPVSVRGVGDLRLAPGNMYRFAVVARDAGGEVIARWRKTPVYVPWPGRAGAPYSDFIVQWTHGSPIYEGAYYRRIALIGGRETSTEEQVERFIDGFPGAFELEYVHVGRAWLAWHAGRMDESRAELRDLIDALPPGNLARSTAVDLLRRLEAGESPPRRLSFYHGSQQGNGPSPW